MFKRGIQKRKKIDTEEIITEMPELNLDTYGLSVIESGVKKLVSVLWKYDYITLNYETSFLC